MADRKDFITAMTEKQAQAERDARRQAAYLTNLPPSEQTLTQGPYGGNERVSDWTSSALQGIGMPNLLSRDYGDIASWITSNFLGGEAAQNINEGNWKEAGSELVGGGPADAILHGMPNLFKKAAIEDAAKNVDPDTIWKNWGWEQNAKGDWWTETIGDPKMNPNVERSDITGGALPPRGSDFGPFQVDPTSGGRQRSLFSSAEIPHKGVKNNAIPMKRGEEDFMLNAAPSGKVYNVKHKARGGTVSDFVENPQLYEQPGLEFLGDIPMQLSDEMLRANPNASGLYHVPTTEQAAAGSKGKIDVRSNLDQENVSGDVINKGNPNPLGTAQHELTHAAAQEFNLPQGFSWLDPHAENQGAYIRSIIKGDADKFDAAFNARKDDFHEYSNDLWDRTRKTISLAKFNEDWAKAHPELGKILEENREAAHLLTRNNPSLAYHTSMGEVSARNSARRDTDKQTYTPQVLRENRPGMTEDVSRKYQWTRDQQTGDIVNPTSASGEPPPGIGDNGAPGEPLPIERGAKPRSNFALPKPEPKLRTKGEKHQVSQRVLRRPYDEMTSTTEMDDSLVPEKEFDWNKVEPDSWFTPLWGDKTWAGGKLTGINETKFDVPVEMQGGSDFTRRPEGNALWGSEPGIAQALTNRIKRLQDTGKDVYGIHSAMGGSSGDFSQQTTKAVQRMLKAKPLSPEDAKAFDLAMRSDYGSLNKKTGKYDFPAVADWPGIENLSDDWMNLPGTTGNQRAKIAKLFDTAKFPSGPDMGSIRKAVTKPSLLNTNIGDTGEAIVKAGPEEVKMITDPNLPHHDYAGQVVGKGSSYEGKSEHIPLKEFWSDWYKGRPPGESEANTAFAFGRNSVVQKFTREMQDKLMKFKKGGGTLGGAVAAGLISAEMAKQVFGHSGEDDDAI